MILAPLHGIRIVDLSRMLAGPYGTLILADMGADVIKIEPPQGDEPRRQAPYVNGESVYFMSVNRNKRGIVLDLKKPGGRDVFYDLIRHANVVFDNYRPGVLERLGADYAALKTINPSIISCSLTAFGPGGPYRDRPAYDVTVQAISGTMSITGEPGGRPVKMGVPVGDMAGGMFAAHGILGALLQQARTGQGQRVEVSMLDAQIALLSYHAATYLNTGHVPQPVGSGHATIVPYGAFRAKDIYLIIACWGEKFWQALCEAIGQPALSRDPRFANNDARISHKADLTALLEETFATRPAAEWLRILEANDIPCAPVNTIDRALAEEQIDANGAIVAVEHPACGLTRFPGSPIRFPLSAAAYRPAPLLGQHTNEVLADVLGYSEERIQALRSQGVIR